MYLTTTTTITAPSLCRINIKNNVLNITIYDRSYREQLVGSMSCFVMKLKAL